MVDVDVPRPAAGQVTIDVAYAGVNFADVMYRRGTVPLALPLTPGIEVSGRIRAVGEGVDHLAPGQPVAALTIVDAGGYAEVVAVDARLVAPLPSEDDDLLMTAAGTPSNTTTAVMALTRAGRLVPGEVILVHAAASGLGSQIGQVAAALKPQQVIGTVGHPDKTDAARAFGYDTVLLRDQWLQDPAAAPRPDLVIDPVGGPARAAGLDALGPDGRLVVIGNASDSAEFSVGTNDLFFTSRTVAGFSLGAISAAHPERAGDALRHAVHLVVSGEVRVDVNTVLPLDQTVEAHRRVESGATTGKTVLAVGRS
ncbi:quinone oxidoreductase family protein [Actinoallomurus rhizosphaericola]|uniref:quinone oxidoreductase family protein n=1 Tax=Actinoallomurus rhizosphaericola TaxID=2952536 RepID=UPI002090AB5F|nr:zinc-binding dehydrogenase [Actinoallomurus rhizosphaericola]